MKLLPNEEKLITSNADQVVLTDHRILLNERVWGRAYTNSIFLEDISSIETEYKSNPLLLILATLCILGGIYLDSVSYHSRGNALIGCILGVFLLAIWWFGRNHIVSIEPNGGSALRFAVWGKIEIGDFIHQVSVAKQKHINLLYKI